MNDPKDIFKKFGQSARHVLITSQRIAQNMKSGIGTEHFLLAMTVTASNLAYDILKENAINLDQVKLILSLHNIRTNLSTGLSREAKKCLASAAQKAQKLGHNSIESEHILWAIAQEKDCRAYQTISYIGINIKEIQDQLNDIFEEVSSIDNFIDKKLEQINQNQMFPRPGFEFVMPGVQRFGQKQKSSSKTPFLDQYGADLTRLAKQNKLDPLIGRQKEITRTIQILCRRTKNNPVLMGEPGVGKTSIVEGLAQKIVEGEIPVKLQNKRIINLDLSMIVAGTMYRGQFEDRIKKIIQEIIKSKNIILFIDEVHTVIGAGNAEGSIDAANILKPSLAKGQIHLIGATTTDEYKKHIEKDKALERRLQIVKVNEPTTEESIKILQGIKKNYENHHQVKISNEALKTAAILAKRYISDRFLPDKAIDLIDEAAAAKQIASDINVGKNKELIKIQKKINDIKQQKEEAAGKQNYQNAAKLRYDELKLTAEIQKLEIKDKKSNRLPIVNTRDIAQVVSLWTSIPLENLIQTEKKQFLCLEHKLRKYIIGQNQAIKLISNSIKRAKSRIANPSRPIGTFIFLGPTGVGKTELAKQLAKLLFASEEALVKLDMSEFMEKHNISRLIGAPPGYVGYEDAGKLTEQVRRNPYSVILFDEIEKAHPEIFNILLQILEDGYLTDAKGRRVNFRNTIIILTSNIGVQELNQEISIGFKKQEKSSHNVWEKYDKIKKTVLDQLKKEFKPELLNRIDDIIVFEPLSKKDIAEIVDLKLKELTQRLKQEGITINVGDKVKKYITKISYNPKYGAREIRRKIAHLIEDPLSDKLLATKIKPKDKIKLMLKKNTIIFKHL